MKIAAPNEQGQQAATPLSRSEGGNLAFRANSALAWPSLLGLVALFALSSCIVAEPPEFREAVRTRPFLDLNSAVPLPQRVLIVDTKDVNSTRLTIRVRSEDAGEDLRAVFFLDYGVAGEEAAFGSQALPASTYDDTSRAVTWPWIPRPTPTMGCHLLTLIVAHENSFLPNDLSHLDQVKASSDAAFVHWWVNVNPPIDQLNTLVNCPVSMQPGQ